MLLVLDLDETLLYSTVTRLAGIPDALVGEYYVYFRPGLADFLEYATRNFRVAVWTSSSPSYATGIVPRVFPETMHLEFVWTRDQCTRGINRQSKETSWSKDLRKVNAAGFSIATTVLIDDQAGAPGDAAANHIQVIPFTGQTNDTELALLAAYLDTMKAEPDVRKIEKRNWRLKVPTRLR